MLHQWTLSAHRCRWNDDWGAFIPKTTVELPVRLGLPSSGYNEMHGGRSRIIIYPSYAVQTLYIVIIILHIREVSRCVNVTYLLCRRENCENWKDRTCVSRQLQSANEMYDAAIGRYRWTIIYRLATIKSKLNSRRYFTGQWRWLDFTVGTKRGPRAALHTTTNWYELRVYDD